MAQGPIINYDAYIISPGTDLTLTGQGTPNLTASYGDYGEGGAKKADCVIGINYTDINYTINNDNSITVTGRINGAILTRVSTGVQSTHNQTIRAYFNGNQTFEAVVATDSSGTYDLNIPDTFSVTIPPSNNPQPAYPAAIEFYNATTGTYSPDRFYLGIIITNPNPPDYRPGAIWDGSSWQSHNRSNGATNVWNGSEWQTMRTVNGDGATTGDPPYIYNGSNWANMRRIGDNA